MPKIFLVDTNPVVIDAWKKAFQGHDVKIVCGNILEIARGTIVSPANSSGFLDGGIDSAYLSFFGNSIQERIQDAIRRRPEQNLPVGASIVVETGYSRIPSMIIAPSMVMPETIPAMNCYRAFRAALRVSNDPLVTESIFCPGIGTGVGRVEPIESAKEMVEAFRDWKVSLKMK